MFTYASERALRFPSPMGHEEALYFLGQEILGLLHEDRTEMTSRALVSYYEEWFTERAKNRGGLYFTEGFFVSAQLRERLWLLYGSYDDFEAAEASFELLMKKALKKYKKFFELEGFRVVVEKRSDKKIASEAIIKLKVKGVKEHTAAEGDGPVNALDNALRKALKDFYPTLSKMHLSDFKVRVLEEKAGTASRVRVLIQSQDETDTWSTIGVSGNIIEASWQALVDSVEYKLLKDRVE